MVTVSTAPSITSVRLGETAHQAAHIESLKNIARGLSKNGETLPKALPQVDASTPPEKDKLSHAISSVKAILDDALRDAADEAEVEGVTVKKPLSPEVQRITRSGAIYTGVAGLTSSPRPSISEPLTTRMFLVDHEICPFNQSIVCDPHAKFRTIDGSCNNLQNPTWGQANTPFERFLPPDYEDGHNSPRKNTVLGTPLPLPRVVSTNVHKKSSRDTLNPNVTHLTMEFGQFIGHDINLHVGSTGTNGSSLRCCNQDGSVDNSPSKAMLGCFPIEIPRNDPYFSQFNKTCMNFVRAAGVPDLECKRGYREQLNKVTPFIDASTVYGSDAETQEDMRTKTDGLLKVTCSVNGELLHQTTPSESCAPPDSSILFKAGDVRVNQHPALMAVHTLFLREHNRIARELKVHNPSWDDERLYQEARKIVGAEVQHITYTAYLSTILGTSYSRVFGFHPQHPGQYFSDYDPSNKPEIRNAFVAAAFRFGHSTVRDHVAQGFLFKDEFVNPHLMYEAHHGPSFILNSLTHDHQQKCDNLLTTQLTDHLFEFRGPGSGFDLASINIQRGRDHGLPNYNEWRVWCGFAPARSFNTSEGGLVDHSPEVANLLNSVYSHPDDIDLWTGIVSESPVESSAVIGPTGACIIGRQFWILKRADRFYYETDDLGARFAIDQLDEIRKISLAKIICDNTIINAVPPDVFRDSSVWGNWAVPCSSLPGIDLSKWSDCTEGGWSTWSAFTPCVSGERIRTRTCQSPCPMGCPGSSFELVKCGDEINFPI